MRSLVFLAITALCSVTGQYYPGVFVPPPPPPGIYAPSNYPGPGWVGQPNPVYPQPCKQPRNDYQGVKRHDLFVGCVTHQFDKLLYVDRFEKSGRWWTTREKIVDYPSFGRGVRRNETITGVWAFDKSSDDSGRVSIIKGGVGHKNVTVKFFSEGSGRGFHYLLQIYGH